LECTTRRAAIQAPRRRWRRPARRLQ
jgi:hypothetical protein